jgi:serine O-acetyltransferase
MKLGKESVEKNSFLKTIAIDYKNNSKKSFVILLLYRIMHFCFIHKLYVLNLFLGIIKGLIYFLLNIDAQISYEAEIGSDIRLPHSANGVVISSYAIIEDHQTIYHQVTIGVNEKIPKEERKVIIRENCYLSAGCKVISCELSPNCKIGPNAVAYKDLPTNSILVSKCEMVHSQNGLSE